MSQRLSRTITLIATAALGFVGCAQNERATTTGTDDTGRAAVVVSESETTAAPGSTPTSPSLADPTIVAASEPSEAAGSTNTPSDKPAKPAPLSTGRMALEEGKMGKRGSTRSTGQYAMKSSVGVGGKGSGLAAPARVKRRRPSGPPAPSRPAIRVDNPQSGEDYENYGTNPMVSTAEDHLSTFAVDVDTASYAIARRKIIEGQAPPAASVRVEEFVNYFKYDYAGPTNASPFAVHMDAAPSPFTRGRHILRVGVQAKKLSKSERKPAHVVFLVDVSGSMSSPTKLPLAKRAMRMMVNNLNDGDTVAMVTYAGNTRVVLEPTGVDRKADITNAIEDLSSGGSTAMASGLDLAYKLAAEKLGPNSVSRVIVLSDGDANVGATSHRQILRSIAGKVKEGVTLSTIGFGMGNYKDTMMEQLANKGNGNYYYIDTFSEAKKVFQEQLGATLEVVAKDVKIQVDFDKKAVERYRLVGYENRDIADVDFRNDRVDAGEIGAGHTVTAVYEVVLRSGSTAPLATVRIRAKKPRGTRASETAYSFNRDKLFTSFDGAPTDFRFATSVVAAAEILRRSPHADNWRIDQVISIARGASAESNNERQEFISLLQRIKPLKLARR